MTIEWTTATLGDADGDGVAHGGVVVAAMAVISREAGDLPTGSGRAGRLSRTGSMTGPSVKAHPFWGSWKGSSNCTPKDTAS